MPKTAAKGTTKEIQQRYGKLTEGITVRAGDDKKLGIESFDPFKNHVVIELIPPDEQSDAGIIIPEMAQEEKSIGRVVKISSLNSGDCPEEDKSFFDIGDYILFRPAAGQFIELSGREFQIIQYFSELEGDILGRWPSKSLDK